MTLYLSAVWTQSGESGNTLKIKCSGTADERANIFPCLQRRRRSEQQPKFGKRHNALRLLNKPPQRRQSGAVAHDFGSLHRKQKAPEYLRGCALWDRSLSVETSGSIYDSPTAVPQLPNKKTPTSLPRLPLRYD